MGDGVRAKTLAVLLLLKTCDTFHHHDHHHHHYHHHHHTHDQAKPDSGIIVDGDWGLDDGEPATESIAPPASLHTRDPPPPAHEVVKNPRHRNPVVRQRPQPTVPSKNAPQLRWQRVAFQKGAGPVPRTAHASTLLGGTFYVFGGKTYFGRYVDDLWCLNTEAESPWRWEQLHRPDPKSTTSGPSPVGRVGASMDGWDGALYLLGGLCEDGRVVNELWKYSIPVRGWSLVRPRNLRAAFPKRQGHATAMVGPKLYAFGGNERTHQHAEMFRTDLSMRSISWEQLRCSGDQPAAAEAARMISASNASLLLLGGGTVMHPHQVLMSFEPSGHKWTRLHSKGIPSLEAHTFTRVGQYGFAFGGFDGRVSLANVARLDLQSGLWKTMAVHGRKPDPRCDHTAFEFQGDLFIFGGGNFAGGHDLDAGIFNDMWRLHAT